MLSELEYAVECRRKTGNCDLGWHTIAAFDSKTIAHGYMRDCRDAHERSEHEYRVRQLTMRDCDDLQEAWAAV